jgi:hypothetical protein
MPAEIFGAVILIVDVKFTDIAEELFFASVVSGYPRRGVACR